MSDKLELQAKSKDDWIELFPYGVTLGVDQSRPILIFKDKHEKYVLPVQLSPQDAGLAINEKSPRVSGNSPHVAAFEIMKHLDLKLDRCVFKNIKGHHQFVDLFFTGSDELKKLHLRADSVMSFCLHSETKYFCCLEYIKESRQLDAEMNESEHMHVGINPVVHPEGRYLN